MSILIWPLSTLTFFIGWKLGRAYRPQTDYGALAKLATYWYSAGYGAAIKEFGIERRLPQKLEIVGGKDVEGA